MKGVSLQVSANTVLRGIFTCLLVVTVACSSDLVDTAESKKGTRDKSEGSIASMSQQLDSIGLIHNAVLDVAYNALVSNQIPVHSSPLSRTAIADSCHVVVNAYFSSLGMSSSGWVNSYTTYAPRMSGSLVDFADTCSALNSTAKLIIKKLDTAIVRYSDGIRSLAQFDYTCDSLKSACISQLSGDQVVFAGAAVATARASAAYWDANSALWDDELDYSTLKMSKSDKAILRSDAQGAVGGAILGVFGGPVGILSGAWFSGCVGSIIEGVCIGFGW